MTDPSQFVSRAPLTERERALIEAAKTQPWTPALRTALASAVEGRGYRVGRFDSPGDLVDFLEMVWGER